MLALIVTGTWWPAGHAAAASSHALSYAGAPLTVDALQLPARVVGPNVDLAVNGAFQPRFWTGVNLGSTIPGRQPGEVAATRPVYDRWFAEMGALGVHVVRVYTILKPDFYDALLAYNTAHPSHPIYVIHGVWIPEDEFLASHDLYSPAVTNGFRSEIRDAVDVVHGDADLPVRPGHASGRYRSDISRWLLAWSIGVEWDPNATADSDAKNAGMPAYSGKYFQSVLGSTPTESWLASMLDYTAGLEAARGWSRPLTFTNWLTADPLHHPYEPLAQEDKVSIDATHISATGNWPGGFFASYHVYPYYPDFLRRTPEYQTYRRPRDGKIDPYAGYLHALRAYHGSQAVMVTEFGVPSSLGMAHYGPLGRNQGNHSEQQAASMNADMLRDIHDEGYAGGIMFEWIDEWFKFTWNTVDYAIPGDRRQLWINPLTNEEHFGVMAADPGPRQLVTLDGKATEWTRNGSQVIAESRGPVSVVRALKDEGYLYIMIRLKSATAWTKKRLTVGFDVRPGDNRGLPGLPGVDPQADVALTVGPGAHAHLYQAAWTDPIAFQYGMHYHYVPYKAPDLQVDSGAWVSPRLVLNRPLTIPATGQHFGIEVMDLGALHWGTTNPAAPDFDSRNLIMARGTVIEIRLPWEMLTFSDPSSRQVYVPHPDGTFTSESISRVGIAVATSPHDLLTTSGYSWDPWNAVQWHERRKAGWNTIKAVFASLANS